MRPLVPAAGLVLGAIVVLNLSGASAATLALTSEGTAGTTRLWQASFSPPPPAYSLSVTVVDSTTGGNTIVSEPEGIFCGDAVGTCRAGYLRGSTVTLTASDPAVDWGGACDFTTGSSCVPELTANTYVEAVFP